MSNIQFVECSVGYRQRTIINCAADMTIAFALDFDSAGEIITRKSTIEQGKIYRQVFLNRVLE